MNLTKGEQKNKVFKIEKITIRHHSIMTAKKIHKNYDNLLKAFRIINVLILWSIFYFY